MTTYNKNASSGMTLVEVLVSMFVLSIGLMGVMAALPIGGYAIQQATIADRASACGRAALAEAKIRDWATPCNWQAWDGSGYVTMTDDGTLTGNGMVEFGKAFALDPYYLASNNNVEFPYNTGTATTPQTLERITLPGMNQLLADRLFTWDDQLQFGEVTQEDSRPRLLQNFSGGVYETPVRPWEKSSAGDPQTNACKGEFTWMLTVVPKAADHDGGTSVAYSTEDQISEYEVSAVVFHKRIALAPGAGAEPDDIHELAVDCTVLGSGIGGGDVELFGDAAQLESLRKIEYLMLSGTETVQTSNGPDQRAVCHWYRVIGYADVDSASSPASVFVTLNGPDWDGGPNPTAILARDVVGVYTTAISAE